MEYCVLFKKLEKAIKKKGLMQVALDLGYKGTSGVTAWIRAKRIPPIALEKVEKYLKESKDENK